MSEARMPLIELPSGAIISGEEILFVARKELNQYIVVYRQAAQAPMITGADLDALRQLGLVQKVAPDVAANDAGAPKLVTE